jgi:hypothetical protein
MTKRMLSPNAPAAKWHFNFSALWLYCSEHSVFIVITLWLWMIMKLNPRWIHCTFDRNKKFSSASKVVRLLFAQRFITWYQGIPPHQRLCEQCDSGEVEDAIHFLLCCSKFREERQQLFRSISQSCNNFLQLNPPEKFYWLMTCEDVSVLKELCHFIYKYCR